MINNPQREVALEAPIPGHGLTAPLGGRPWQQPPQFTTVEQAIEFYTPKIMDKKFELIYFSGLPFSWEYKQSIFFKH